MIGILFGFLISMPLLFYIRKYIKGGQCTIKHSMKDKTIIITGASSGLGKYAMIDLVSSGAKIIMGCRSEAKAKEAIASLTEEQKKQVDFIRLDLCNFQSIIEFVKKIKEKYSTIDILMNNAGAQPTNFAVTKDGFESFIQGNYLGMVLLSNLLLKHFNEKEGKIINISSIAHFWSDLNETNYDVLLDNQKMNTKYFSNELGKFNLYCTSKLLVMLFTEHLSKYCEHSFPNIKVASVHPGIVNTNYTRFLENYPFINIIFKLVTPIWIFLSKTALDGAQTQLYLSYLPFAQLTSGGYYTDCHISSPSKKINNDALKKKVIDWTISSLSKYQ